MHDKDTLAQTLSLSNGDLLNDTPADPISDESGMAKFVFNCNFANPNNIRDNSSCQNLYVGVLINNMMALPVGCSRTTFTTGQISRMKLFLDDRLASINNTIPVVVANKFNGGVIPNSEIKPSTLKIDVTDYNSGSIVVWSEEVTTPISKWMKRTSTVYSTPASLSNSGIQSQVCGGTDYQYMSAMVFKNTSLPYYFLKSTTDFSVENPGEEDGEGLTK